MFARVAPFAFLVFAALFLSSELRAEPDAALATVSGTVSLAGQPLDGAMVTFYPEAKDGKKATGKTDANGKYTLKTGEADGAAVGKYRVTISLKRGDKEVLPARYSDKDKTALVIDVAKSDNQHNFNLASK
jgi:hypothetical protein